MFAFEPDDFKLPLEKELRLKLLTAEIEECTDVKVLQENTKALVESLMHHQHLLSICIRAQLEQGISELMNEVK